MTLIKFFLCETGNRHEITKGKLPAVPRVDDHVVLNDTIYEVRSVVWDVTRMEVHVNLVE